MPSGIWRRWRGAAERPVSSGGRASGGDPEGDGDPSLGIPTVKDRIVQAAVKRVIEPIFEHAFLPMSYGFRPGRGCKDALREVDGLLQAGYTYVVDADLAQYFDTIPHEALMARVEERISDGRLLELLRAWLRQDVVRSWRAGRRPGVRPRAR
jgi:RNA-directed DNA polymerase